MFLLPYLVRGIIGICFFKQRAVTALAYKVVSGIAHMAAARKGVAIMKGPYNGFVQLL